MFFGAAVADIRRFIQQGTEFLNEIRTVGVTFFAEGAEIFLGGGAGRAQGRVRTTDTMPAGIIATSIAASLFKYDMVSDFARDRSTIFANGKSNLFKGALLGKHT